MSVQDLKRTLLALLEEPGARDDVRRALGVPQIDALELLDRLDRNTEELAALRKEFQAEMAALRAEFQAEMAALRREFHAEMAALRGEFQAEMAALRKEFQAEMLALRQDFQAGIAALREHTDQGFLAMRRRLDALGSRWGISAEEAFREGMTAVLEEILPGYRIAKWRRRDEEGKIHGLPAWVEVDIAVDDGKTVLVEVKSSASRGDVAALARVARFYEEVEGKRPDRILLVSPYVDPHAQALAEAIGIEISTSTGSV